MGTPGFYTDLSVVASAESTETWIEFTGAVGGGAPDEAETENYIQGGSSTSQSCGAATGWKSVGFDLGSPRSIPAAAASFHWMYFSSPQGLETYANSGMGIVIGNTVANWKLWFVHGRDTYPYGGWINIAVDPLCAQDGNYGSPTSSTQVFGQAVNLFAAVTKGQAHVADMIRTGRSLVITAGQGSPATFASAGGYNDLLNNRWGLCQNVAGGYLVKGRFQIGTATTCADFRDTNKAIFIQDLKRVQPGFTIFEINHADSVLGLSNCLFTSLGSNARGNFVCSADATVQLTGCSFTDMGAFWLSANTDVYDSVFRRCKLVKQGGSTLNGCLFDSSTDATEALLVDNPSLLTDCTFIMATSGNHAIELTTACAGNSYNFNGNIFTGYSTSGTASAAIYNNSGGAVELVIGGGGDTAPTIKNGSGASTVLCAGLVTLTLTTIALSSEVRLYAAGTTTELAGEENSNTSFSYNYKYSSGTYIDIVIHHVDYIYYRVDDYLLGSSNASIPISQQTDRQYNNP